MKVELDHDGIKSMLCGAEVDRFLKSCGHKVASRAGGGCAVYTYEGGFGGGRRICVVSAQSKEARESEASNKTLTKAIGGRL